MQYRLRVDHGTSSTKLSHYREWIRCGTMVTTNKWISSPWIIVHYQKHLENNEQTLQANSSSNYFVEPIPINHYGHPFRKLARLFLQAGINNNRIPLFLPIRPLAANGTPFNKQKRSHSKIKNVLNTP
ncbi:hypothetical protein CEXT_708811 [Caerostris extrusa]|uniref:Uncharacterized protein n=1 Tax=Caerostris extrusa TaxID=172846 RepID=A0AAV4N682_CAEEX|nr:hypothetical protein CEXT_708811 [Caerostris extrusa]